MYDQSMFIPDSKHTLHTTLHSQRVYRGNSSETYVLKVVDDLFPFLGKSNMPIQELLDFSS